jgi:DNA-binding PadR family transcriptional regulator
MSQVTNAEAALLGLLSEKPMYPYQIEHEVKQRDMRFWTELSMSSIYKLLRKLEAGELVSSHVEISDENRTRKIYEVTEGGNKEFKEKLHDLLCEPEHKRWGIDIAISNLNILPREEAIACLREYHDELTKKINGYGELEKYLESENCPDYRMSLARRPKRILEGDLKWCEEYLVELGHND